MCIEATALVHPHIQPRFPGMAAPPFCYILLLARFLEIISNTVNFMYIYSFKFFLQVFKIGMDQRQIFLSPEFLFSILYGCLILVECNQPACCQLAEEIFGMASAAQGGIYIDTFRMYIQSIHCFFQ